MMSTHTIKNKRKHKTELPKAPDPTFEPDYIATKKDLVNLATKSDLNELRITTKNDLHELKLEIISTMATKTELRILVTLIMIGLTILGLLIRSGH